MQGRLSAPSPAGAQVFPAATWRDEFAAARAIGFDTIEWLVEADSFASNPLLSPSGRDEIKKIESSSGVRAASVCAHCVLQWRPFDEGGAARMEPFSRLIIAAGAAGVERIIVPILEEASVAKAPSLRAAADAFAWAIPFATQAGVELVFEMDRPAEECVAFIHLLNSACARLCYDTGNATAHGCDIVAEINQLLPHVAEIHLKDRRVHGSSQPLGSGDTRFAEFFGLLSARRWPGPFVLETPVLDDSVSQARKNFAFVKQHLSWVG